MSKRDKFEDEWNSVFDGAQDHPSNRIWSEIKAELSSMEAGKQRNKVIYWRWFGVAASVVILMMVGVYGFNLFTSSNSISSENELAVNNSMDKKFNSNDIEMNSISSNHLNKEKKNIVDNTDSAHEESILNSEIDVILKEDNAIDEVEGASVLDENRGEYSNKLINVETKNQIEGFIEIEKPSSLSDNQNEKEQEILPKIEGKNSEKEVLYITTMNEMEFLSSIDTVVILAQLNTDIYLQKVPDLSELFKYNNKKSSNMWAGVSMGGGSFNPNVGEGGFGNALFASEDLVAGSNLYTITTADKISNEATETPSFSYNFSMNFGKFITKRLLIESGVEYAKYSSEASSNLTSNTDQEPKAFLRNMSNDRFSYASLQTATTYQLVNSYEYLSVPLSFGYVLIDKKIGILISSGVSADIFLNNTLQDQSGKYDPVIQKNGDDSPYRPINLNALLGGEIYYSWNENYVIAIDPEYRISMSGITKRDASFNSRPTSFLLGLKFKYLL